MHASLFLSGLLAAAAVAVDPYPPDNHRYNVKLIAHVTGEQDLSPPVEGRALNFYHIGAGEAYAVLGRSVKEGLLVYQNGTGYDDRTDGATTQFDGGLGTYGMQVLKSGAVTLNPGKGTVGVQQTFAPASAGPWTYRGRGSWYACYSHLPFGGNYAQLFWRKTKQATPEGCVDVRLYPKCQIKPKLAKKHKTDMPINCWNNVEESLKKCGEYCELY